MSVGLALIAKNEATRLPSLLKSIEGSFDRVVLLDTGSRDNTIDVFIAWAREQTGMTFAIGNYEWKDDFADARSIADGLLVWGNTMMDPMPSKPMVDWTCWADCDDIVRGAQNIKTLCDQAEPHVVAFLVGYDYARDEAGTNVSYLWRERMVRAGHGKWLNRVHEAQNVQGGGIAPVSKDILEWVHAKTPIGDADPSKASNSRNLRILRKWAKDEPHNPRVLSYLGIEEQIRGQTKRAMSYYRRYLKTSANWDEERAQVHRRLGMCFMAEGKFDDAIATALIGMQVLPSWADSYITLAEAYLSKGEFAKAAEWARQALDRGPPVQTLLIVNPTDYSFLPRKLLAGALSELGQIKEALDLAKEALGLVPDQQLGMAAQQWQSTVKRENTADTYAIAGEQLISHDEQMKALNLLENCVPVFATDHPRIVGLRSALRERLAWTRSDQAFTDHYITGGSKPEDFIPDNQVDDLCERLPRCGFLLDGILEQHAGLAA